MPARPSRNRRALNEIAVAHTVPALTTMRMPITQIVGAGVKLAIELARDPPASREPRITV